MRILKYFHMYFINFRPQSAYNPAASLITYCPCGCGKEDHNGGSGDSSASSTGGTLSSGSLPSPNNLSAIVNAATNLTSLQHNQNNSNNMEQHPTTKYPESPDLSPVKPFQLSSTTKAGTTTIVPTTSITQPPFHLLQPVPSVACTQAATNISPQSSSSSSYSSSEVPLDMSKTSPMFVKSSMSSNASVARITTTPVTTTQQQAKVCSIQTPPPPPPENDRDKFRCLYLLVDAAMEQLDEIAAKKRRSSSTQEVSSLQITIPTHNPPTQPPQQLAALHPHQQICA